MRLKYVTLVAAVGYLGFVKSSLVSVSDIFRLTDLTCRSSSTASPGICFAGVHRRLDGAVGAAVLRAHLRVRRADAADRRDRAAKLRVEMPARLEQRAAWIKYGLLAGVLVLLPGHARSGVAGTAMSSRSGCSRLFGTTAMWIGLARAAVGDAVRPESVLPVPLPGRRDARHHLEADACSGSSAGPSARPARSARRPANGARSAGRRSSRANACAATTASGSTSTSRSARTGSSCGEEARCSCRRRTSNGGDAEHARYGLASVGGASRTNLSFKPDDTSTSFVAVTITAFDVAAAARSAPCPSSGPENEHAFREPRRRAPGCRRRSSRCGTAAPADRSADRGCGDSGRRP